MSPFSSNQSIENTVGDAIDRQVTVDVQCNGIIGALYLEAKRQSAQPLCVGSGNIFSELITRGGSIVILTGYPVPLPYATDRWEVHSDGPVGVASLVDVLSENSAIDICIVTDSGLGHIISACCNANREGKRRRYEVIELPNKTDVQERCEDILRTFAPKVIISSEKSGRNSNGEYHTALGQNLTDYVSKADDLFEMAQKGGITTIGIGDLGNEIGFGNLSNVTRNLLKFGRVCRCECKSGIVSSTRSDFMALGAMSDWGVYAILSYLAFILEEPRLVPDIRKVVSIMNAFASECGLASAGDLMTDGISIECTASCLSILSHIVDWGIKNNAT